ncbi:MAG: hypothetical protein ACXWRZ_06575 [Bdellovibrio sp.]
MYSVLPYQSGASLYRLNKWFISSRIPMTIGFQKGLCQLHAHGHVSIQVHRHFMNSNSKNESDRLFLQLQLLKEQYPPSFRFRRYDAALLWKVSQRTANLWLQQAEIQGLLKKESAGPQTRYYFFSSQ